jgi:hypothetical protein
MARNTQSGLAVVGRYSYLHEADLAKAFLESEGIRAWILDEHQIRHRWHLGAALGGVKLAVAPELRERARGLLSEDHSEDLADIPEQRLSPHIDEICQRCGATAEVEQTSQRLPGPIQWLVSLFFLLLGLLVPRRRFAVTRQCASCGNQWSQVERR